MDENAGWNDDYPMWDEPSDRFGRNQPPPYPEPHGPAGRGTSNDRGREYRQSPNLGQQRGRAVPARLPEEPALGPGKRSDGRGRRAGAPGQTSYQWAAKQRKHILSTRRGRIITAIVSACLLLGMFGTVGLAYAEYRHVKSQAAVGLTDLKSAEVDLKTLETNPFDTTAITAAQGELTQANLAFIQMNDSIQHIPGVLGLVPIVGSEVDAVLQIGPIAVEATQAGVLGCQILGILAPKLKNPLTTSIAGLTTTDIATIDGKFTTLYSLASTILAQVRALPPSATSLDPRLGPLLSSVSTNMPQFEQGLQDAKNVVAMLPQLLGVGKPANYLLEVMDSTELRPGGGFIGNFGDVTLSGGRMQGKPQIKDVDLLDQHYKGITLPSQFSWFTSGGRVLGFRDSNLDADFPSDAKRAIQIYNYENGSSVLDNNSAGPITSFQGVIAVTPQLIEQAMAITGNITLPQYGGLVVTPQNLIDTIHIYQLTPGLGGSDTQIDPSCQSSQRKVFTCYLFKAFLSKLGQASSTNFGKLGKLVENAIHGKDIQIYLANPGAEALLQHHDLASAITAPTSGDGLMVVDANVGGIKANNQIQYTWNDRISLDASGDATHHLMLTYDWPNTPYNSYYSFPCMTCSLAYQDFLRIYIPKDATHILPPDTSELDPFHAPTVTTGFNMTVVEGLLYQPIGTKSTVSLSWTVPHAALRTGGSWLYQYAVEKQAGINTRPVDVSLTLPACARIAGPLQGFTTPTAQSAIYNQSALTSDVTLSLGYTC